MAVMRTKVDADPPKGALIGRRREVERVRGLLSGGVRLVTLTGPGGVGKSRIAAAAAGVLGRSLEGLWPVDLASVTADPVAVVAHHLKATGPGESLDAISKAIGASACLIVLDNCEHLLGDVASMCSVLLERCPHLKFMVTSTEPVGVDEEVILRISPLAKGTASNPGPAVQLFLERARRIDPDFAPTAPERETIGVLCELLGCLPLAIELAAARLQYMDLNDIVAHTTERLGFLKSDLRDPRPHSAALTDSLDWSWSLCSADERVLWAALSCLPSGWDLPIAEALAAQYSIPKAGVDEMVFALVRKSVVEVRPALSGKRYGMLAPIARFGLDKLPAADLLALQSRHVEAMTGRLMGIEDGWLAGPQSVELARLVSDLPQLRYAISNASARDGRAALTLATTAFRQCWHVHGDFEELAVWTTRALAAPSPPDHLVAAALTLRAVVHRFAGKRREAMRDLEAAQDLAKVVNRPDVDAAVLAAAGECAPAGGDALDLLSSSIDAQGADAFTYGRLNTPTRRALHLAHAGRLEESEEAAREIHRVCASAGDHYEASYLDIQLATAALARDDHALAETLARNSLRAKRGLHNPLGVAHAEEVVAAVLAEHGDHAAAARLFGTAAACRRSIGALPSARQPFFTARGKLEQSLRDRLGDAAFRSQWDTGASLSEEQGIDLALGNPLTTDTSLGVDTGELTPREHQISRLVAEGKTNKAIAAELFISIRTVETHVQNILVKLGLTSRTQLAAWTRDGTSMSG